MSLDVLGRAPTRALKGLALIAVVAVSAAPAFPSGPIRGSVDYPSGPVRATLVPSRLAVHRSGAVAANTNKSRGNVAAIKRGLYGTTRDQLSGAEDG